MTKRKGISGTVLSASASIGALVSAWSGVASAQDVSGAASSDQEEIVVIATRREESQIETPVAVSVVDVDAAISAGVSDINAIADFVPGLNATDGGSPGLGNLVIRGLYTGSGATTVGVYVDDVPFGPVVGGAGNSLALDASLFDLDRLEVVRGPQGTLFGASALGGVVRYVTRAPSLTETEGYLFADVASTEGGGVSNLVRGRVSLPIANERFAISLSGFHNDAAGYTDHPLRGEEDVDDSTFWGGLFSARAQVSDNLSVRFNVMRQEADYDSTAAEAFDLVTGQRLLGERQDVTSAPTPRTLEFDLYSLVADWDLGWATLSSATSQQRLNFANQSDLTLAFGGLADFLAPGGAPHTVGFESAFDTERFTQEFRLTSPENDRLEWLVGLYYTDQTTDDTQRTIVTPNDVQLLDASLPTGYTETAVFGNVTFYLTPRWDVTVGARVADIETTLDSQLIGSPFLIGPGPFPSGSVNSDTVTTYLVNTRYRVSDDFNLYARAASGYRPGGANLILQVGPTTIGEPRYEPDNVWSYEAGAKGRLLSGRLTYDASLYFVNWSDAQLLNVASGLGAFANAQGDVHVTGFEASITGEVADNLFITGALELVESELQSDEAVLGGARGEGLPNTPDATFSLAADYNFAIGGPYEGMVGATWRYTGEYNTTYDGNGVISPSLPNYQNDAYSQFDFRAGIRRGAVSANFYVTNLTNEDAYQTIFSIAPNYAQGIILRPRTYGLNLRVDF